MNHDPARNTADFIVEEFIPIELIAAPAGASHFRLLHALAVIADFSYNPITGTYEPDDAVNNELSVVARSPFIPLNESYSGDTITADLPGLPTLDNTVSVLQCIGIEFFQEVNGVYYPFATGNCLKIEEVF